MRKLLFLIFTLIIIYGSFVIAQTRPSCETPAPFWSPRPTTTQGYVNAICGGGDECYQAWCNYFRPNPGNYQHLDEIPTSYYTQTYTQTSCTGTCKTNACVSYQSCSSTTGTCPSGNCCTGSCTTATQTCIQAGGTCKTNVCSSYSSCSSATGTCTTGNCCLGSCTTVTTETVNTEELKTVLINAIKDYFSSQTPKLTVNELKDLIVVYFQTSGNTADLSGMGKYSGENLVGIYNKAKGTICIPDCTGKCGGASNGCGGTCNASCGLLGSKTNPVSINKFYGGRSLIYYPSTGTNGSVITLLPNSKTYFVVDSLVATSKSVSEFYFIVKGYNNADLVYTIVPQSKATGQDLVPEGRIKYGVYDAYDVVVDMKPYDLDNTKFLYAIENKGGAFAVEMGVQFMLPTPAPTPIPPVPSGPLGSKTNPIKINKSTSKILGGYIPSTSPNDGRGTITLPANTKLYFEVDPSVTTGRSVIGFGLSVKFFSGAGAVCELTQSKITGIYSSESCKGYTSFIKTIYDNKPNEVDDTKFLFAIDNTGVEADAYDEIWATINPAPAPAPLGPLGSKTNPYKINKSTVKVLNGYIPENSIDDIGTFSVSGGAKIYFEIDPVATAGVSSGFFKLGANFLSGAGTICKLTQDKNTGAYSSESCFGSDGLIDIVPITSNTKYLYAIDNNLGGGYVFYVIQVSIPLFPVPTPAPVPSGPLGSKTNPYKINKPTSRVWNGYIPENTVDTGLAPGMFTIPAGSKIYFELDPVATIGPSVGAFKVGAVFYYGGGAVCKLTQNKSTGAYSSEVCAGTDSYMDIVYDKTPLEIDDYKFLYAFDNTLGGGAVSDAIWVQIPFVP